MEAIDKAKKGQAIVFDEAIMNMGSQDSGSNLQKILIKKMVTIRKLNLFIFIVLPSVFLLKKYFAIFRTRALIHFYSPNGLERGYFKFYSYDRKRKLYLRGLKEFDQSCVKPDFFGRATDTSGFFFDEKEYDAKKDEAIKSITEAPEKKKAELKGNRKQIKDFRDVFLNELFDIVKARNPEMDNIKFADHLKQQYNFEVTSEFVRKCRKDAIKVLQEKKGLSKAVVTE